MTLKFNIVKDDGDDSSVTVFTSAGRMLVASRDHKSFLRLTQALRAGAEENEIITLFDTAEAVNFKFTKVSDRVSFRNGDVFFDNMKVDSALANTIMEFYVAGHDDFMALVNFMEKIETNPNPHSKENLFRWMRAAKFGITSEGDIVAYKGVHKKNGTDPKDEYYTSTRSGPAIVDGEPVNGYVPNNPGVIVEMARNEVTFDPHQTCSKGLHVADWSYARNAMGTDVILQVLINPRDVVSVPSDHSDKKMRVCRYKVLRRVTSEDTTMLQVDKALNTLTARYTELLPPKAPAIISKSEPQKKSAVKKGTKKAAPKKAAPKKAAVKKAGSPKPTVKGDRKEVALPLHLKAAAPKPALKKAASRAKAPKYYEEFTEENFRGLPHAKLQWLCKQWEVKPANRTSDAHVDVLVAEAAVRLERAGKSVKAKTKIEA